MDLVYPSVVSTVVYIVSALIFITPAVIKRNSSDFVYFVVFNFLLKMCASLGVLMLWESGMITAKGFVLEFLIIMFFSPLVLVFINFYYYRKYL